MIVHNSAFICLIDPRDLRESKNTYFSLITLTKQLLLVTICDTTAGIGASFQRDARTHRRRMAAEGQTDVEVEIVI